MIFNGLHSRIDYSDLNSIAPEHYTKHITHRLTEIKAVESPADRSAFIQVLESSYRFTLGSFAGGKLVFLNWSSIFKYFSTLFVVSCRCHGGVSY